MNTVPTAEQMAVALGITLAQAGSVMALCKSCRVGSLPIRDEDRWIHVMWRYVAQPTWDDYDRPVLCQASTFRLELEKVR